MDPVTQAVAGAIGATQLSKKSHMGIATLIGALSGMAADLDIFIRSDTDPLLFLEFHRQFTHSLIFIPIGGLLCALVFYFAFAKRRLSFLRTYAFCTLGYATHGLIDACTTYGTLLFWPFSDMRVAWNSVSIIDPLFTLPLLIFILANIYFKKKWIAHTALAWAIFYLGLGVVQRERAEKAAWEMVKARGLNVNQLEAKASFANLLVWKIVSTTDTHYVVDAIKVGWGKPVIFTGASIEKLDIKRDFPWLNQDSQQAKDIERFRWFSNGYVAVTPKDNNTIIDVRYSMLPNEINGLWGITLDPKAENNAHVSYTESTERSPETFGRLWEMIIK